MSELPRVNAKEILAVLSKAGFAQVRQSGSHKILRNTIGKRVTVPFHGNKTLHPKVLKSILIDAELTPEELKELL